MKKRRIVNMKTSVLLVAYLDLNLGGISFEKAEKLSSLKTKNGLVYFRRLNNEVAFTLN